MNERPTTLTEAQIGDLFTQQWEQEVQNYINSRPLSDKSKKGYAQDLSQVKGFFTQQGITKWSSITPQLINDFTADQEIWCSTATSHRRLTVSGGFIKWLREKTDYPLSENVDEAVQALRRVREYRLRKREFDPLSHEDFSKLLWATENLRDKVILHLLRSKLGPGRIAAIRIQHLRVDWDGENNSVSMDIGKKDKRGRPILLKLDRDASQTTREYLIKDRKSDLNKPRASLLLRNDSSGQPIENSNLTRAGVWFIVKKLADKARIDCTPRRLYESAKAQYEPLN